MLTAISTTPSVLYNGIRSLGLYIFSGYVTAITVIYESAWNGWKTSPAIKEDAAAEKKKAVAQNEQAEANKARKKAAEETSQQRPANAKEEFAKKAAETKWTNDSETNYIVKNRKLAAAAKKQKEAFSAAQKLAEEKRAWLFDNSRK